jgi:hypothetical protein
MPDSEPSSGIKLRHAPPNKTIDKENLNTLNLKRESIDIDKLQPPCLKKNNPYFPSDFYNSPGKEGNVTLTPEQSP